MQQTAAEMAAELQKPKWQIQAALDAPRGSLERSVKWNDIGREDPHFRDYIFMATIKKELRNDKAFVGELVRMDWSHLEFASAELQDDFDFIADAIEASRGDAICFASPRLKTDRCIALLATNASQQRSGRLHASALAAQQTMEGGGPLF